MVQVPVTPRNSVELQPLDARQFRYAESRNYIGPALEQTGQALSRAAEDIDHIEATYDQADVLNLDNMLAADISNTQSQFRSLKGDQPGRELQGQIKFLNDRSEELLKSARSERARNIARRAFAVRVQNAQERLTAHADDEMFKFRDTALAAGRDQAASDAIDQAGTPQFAVAVGTGLTRIEERAKLNGMPAEQLAAERQDFLDKVHGGVVDEMFAVPDPQIDEIGQYVTDHGEQMSPKLRTDIMERLQKPLQGRMDRSDADLVMGLAKHPAQPSGAAVSGKPAADLDTITANSESGGREFAANGERITSPAGARGLMQVMPGTARDPGFGIKPSDGSPAEDSRVGREYRAVMEKRYDGDLAKMWGAYNWGPGNVDKAVQVYGDNWLAHAPKETQDYIAKNIAAVGSGPSAYSNAPREWDRSAVEAQLNTVAQREDWSPERVQRVREELDHRIGRDETLLRDQQNDADEKATSVVEVLGDKFISTNQIPRRVWDALAPSDKMAWEKVAAANTKPKEPEANGPRVMELNLMRYYEPEKFKALNLAQDAGKMTRAELDAMLTTQAQMRTSDEAGKWSPRTGITTAMAYGKKINQLDLKPADEAAILQIMESEARQMHATNGGKALTDNDYQLLFRSATRQVRTVNSFMGINTGTSNVPRYKLTLGNMPDPTRTKLTQRLQQSGLPVTDENLLRLYRLETR